MVGALLLPEELHFGTTIGASFMREQSGLTDDQVQASYMIHNHYVICMLPVTRLAQNAYESWPVLLNLQGPLPNNLSLPNCVDNMPLGNIFNRLTTRWSQQQFWSTGQQQSARRPAALEGQAACQIKQCRAGKSSFVRNLIKRQWWIG